MRKKTIRITWEKPVRLEDKEKWSQNDNIGVYAISRIWGEKSGRKREEKILYFGKTIDGFNNRMRNHTSTWTPDLRGSLYVRFGRIEGVKDLDNDLLEDIESALIYETTPPNNVSKTRCYTFRTDYLVYVKNEGFTGGVIPNIVDAREQLDPESV